MAAAAGVNLPAECRELGAMGAFQSLHEGVTHSCLCGETSNMRLLQKFIWVQEDFEIPVFS